MTTNSTCLTWLSNQEGQNPCTVAQEVGQLCNSGYIVSTTNFPENNYIPNATTANNCTCSWSFYNLLSACSSCVGQIQYTSWSAWTINCGSYGSNDSFLPPGLSLSQGIPYWATTNPSTWDNGIFNITQATNTAEEDKSDVTGVPLPTSTTTKSSSASSVSVGAIVGGAIGGIAIILIGGLLIFWMVRRRRRQRMHKAPTGVPSFNPSQPGIVPSTWNRTPAQPTPYGHSRRSSAPVSRYIASPVHSTTSLTPTPFVSHASPGFSSIRHSTAPPITGAADMLTFHATSPTHQRNRSNTSPLSSKADEALSERVTASSGQRARLNPPSYSASVAPGSSGVPTTLPRRLSMTKHKRKKGSASGTTMYSEHSRTSTKESVTTGSAGPPTARSAEGTVGAGGVGSVDGGGGGGGGVGSGGGGEEITHNRRTGI